MKHVKVTCKCGATLEIDDQPGTYIDQSKTDDHGNRYTIQKQVREWLERHQVCLEARIDSLK